MFNAYFNNSLVPKTYDYGLLTLNDTNNFFSIGKKHEHGDRNMEAEL